MFGRNCLCSHLRCARHREEPYGLSRPNGVRFLLQSAARTVVVMLVMAVTISGCTAVTSPATPAAADEAASTTVQADPSNVEVSTTEPVAAEEALPPVRVAVPALDLELPVEPMTWVTTLVNGERVSQWQVPDEALGWHVNSAGAGAAGNMLLSGHQVLGDALLAPLARGEFQIGQEVVVTDEAGTDHVYRFVDISAPLPIAGATEDETAAAAAYVTTGETPRLTLITGWPDFTSTHRVFAQAEYLGVAAGQ